MQTIDNFLIEITFKKKRFKEIPEQFKSLINEYLQYESDDRVIIDLPRTWSGLKDGTVISLLKSFGEAIYLALAYVADSNDIVVDMDGNPVDKYPIVIDGIQKTKYIKKKLRIIKILDKEKEIFSVKEYVLNLEYFDAVIKVLDMYCVGSASKFNLSDFVSKEVYNEIRNN